MMTNTLAQKLTLVRNPFLTHACTLARTLARTHAHMCISLRLSIWREHVRKEDKIKRPPVPFQLHPKRLAPIPMKVQLQDPRYGTGIRESSPGIETLVLGSKYPYGSGSRKPSQRTPCDDHHNVCYRLPTRCHAIKPQVGAPNGHQWRRENLGSGSGEIWEGML